MQIPRICIPSSFPIGTYAIVPVITLRDLFFFKTVLRICNLLFFTYLLFSFFETIYLHVIYLLIGSFNTVDSCSRVM